MRRILIVGQAGAFGRAACAHVADRLGQRLGLPRLAPDEAAGASSGAWSDGWIAVEAVGPSSVSLFRAADTVVWLHYSAWAVAREWLRELRRKVTTSPRGRSPALADLSASLQHMAWTPYVFGRLQHPSLAHLHIHHLRTPAETDFWLHAQEHRLPQSAAVQPA